ncbi:signal recognition particle-docking protein FtsY [Candidatus Mycoplasma haematobovis]|uniref:signal recognition particle-docking protein FtsY n=1 Tax=Candidatus Mycoplasma haematobovis TaxID=432608 RepID=UPI000A6913B9|nr:signal recognition particle-docking protein FtsY [Candidatus Mycoplasma haematobovis]
MLKFSLKKKRSLIDALTEQNKQQQLRISLEKSSSSFKNIFLNFFKRRVVNEEFRTELEEKLIELDFGYSFAEYLSKEITLNSVDAKEALLRAYGNCYTTLNIQKGRKNILLVVGANGSGKTTSIAKLAYRFKKEGFKVLLAAGDTFRAGAVEQLNVWAKKIGIEIVNPLRDREDPSALIYRSLSEYSDYDLIICDTSGRQHSNLNLLKELNKVYRTIKKFDESAPHESLLVLDSSVGQLAFTQAQSFLDSASISGIILSKMDSLSRGGIIFAIKERLNVPVKFIGTGEQLEDLHEFDLNAILDSWFKTD